MRVDVAQNLTTANTAQQRVAVDMAARHVIAEDEMKSLLYLAVKGGVSISDAPVATQPAPRLESLGTHVDTFA